MVWSGRVCKGSGKHYTDKLSCAGMAVRMNVNEDGCVVGGVRRI